MFNFRDKRVIVTGAASGIGYGTAQGFVNAGASVTLADIVDPANEFASWLTKHKQRVLYVKGDLTNESFCNEVVQQTTERFGGVDVLVNCVGIQPLDSYKTVADLSEEMWDAILGTNVKTYFLMSKFAIPEMRKQGAGAIVNISSVQGLQSMRGAVAYSAAKAAILGMTRTMALDHIMEGIRVNAICPGIVADTGMVFTAARAETEDGADIEDTLRSYGRTQPIGRLIHLDEIVAPIMFFASDAASAITGTHLVVDGGCMALGAWAGGYWIKTRSVICFYT